MNEYNEKSIKRMQALDHIRHRSGMYVGDTSDPTHLLIECIDNAVDEVQNGFANKIYITMNTKEGRYGVCDNGRGIPYDHKLPIEDDPPVMICNEIYTSGKFHNDAENSVYKVSSGLHGVGLTCVNALSDFLNISLFKNGKHAQYIFKHKKDPIRKPIEDIKTKCAYSTSILFKPHKKYFESCVCNVELITERLEFISSIFPELDIILDVDDNKQIIKQTEKSLISKHLSENINDWIEFTNKNKKEESYRIKFNWDFESQITKTQFFSIVNFIKVSDGIHIQKITNAIKNVFIKLAKKNKIEFEANDPLTWFRCFIDLKIINSHFDSQTKNKLSKKSDTTIMDNLEDKLETYFKNNPEVADTLLLKFENYRKSIQNKKIQEKSNKKRGSSGYTKLRDCTNANGELLIGEGESAVGGLIKVRNPDKHAILPLRGVPTNVLNHNIEKLMKNSEVKDILTSLGCGVHPHCDVNKLRYDKIIIAADADPDGLHIAALCIILFAKLTPEVIKAGKLYVCETPLFGYGRLNSFVPIWDEKELDVARKAGHKIRRFKGLGEFCPEELKQFTIDEKNRKLHKIDWPGDEKVNKIFDLMLKSNAGIRRDLALDKWSIDEDYVNGEKVNTIKEEE